MKRVVIKLGTGLLSAGNGNIRVERISQICSGIDLLKKQAFLYFVHVLQLGKVN